MRILFQGDSITDTDRKREDPKDLGQGYVKHVGESLKGRGLDLINLGISGNQTWDLLARLRSDFLDIKPDILTILIGINDTWHRGETKDWLEDSVFESNYESVLKAVREELDCKIIILEPFLLDFENMRHLREDLNTKIDIIRRLARKYTNDYIPLDGIFARLSVKEEPSYWAPDGVHPSEEGHKVIAKALLEVLDKYI